MRIGAQPLALGQRGAVQFNRDKQQVHKNGDGCRFYSFVFEHRKLFPLTFVNIKPLIMP